MWMRRVTGAFAGQTCNNYMYLNTVYYSLKEDHKNVWNHGVKMHHVKREKIAASTAVISY